MRPFGSESGWTPDFSAGVAELELESVLTRFHLVYRTATVAAGALRLVSHPEETERRLLAWAALAVEAGGTVFVWSRTRRWHTMLAPELLPVDTALGIVAVALGSRSTTTDAQVHGTAWTNRAFDVRMAATPLLTTSAAGRATSVVLQAVPLVLGRTRADARRILTAIGPPAAISAAPTVVIANRMRRHAKSIDERASTFVDRKVHDELATERAAFERTVLVPAASTLGLIGDTLRRDTRRAAELAAAEEARIRAWLSDPTTEIDAPLVIDTAARTAAVERTVRQLSRRVQAGIRVASSLSTIGRVLHANPSDRRATAAAIVTTGLRGVVAAALVSDQFIRRIGEDRAGVLASATNLASVAALGRLQLGAPDDRPMSAWIEADAAEMAATAGVVRWDSSFATVGTVTGIGAIRGAIAALRRGPWYERLAGAANEQLVMHSTAYILRNVFNLTLEQTRELTELSTGLAAAEQQDQLRTQRVEQRSLVHDGIAQVLGAVVAGDVDPVVLGDWIDQEVERIERVLDGTGPAPVSIEEALPQLAAEFRRRGLAVVVQAEDVPHWTRAAAGTVAEIVREALNNVLKHTDSRSAWVEVESAGTRRTTAAVTVRVTDFGTGSAGRAGSGIGTQTMLALAEQIGASIEWQRAANGGTEVRLVLTPN